MHIIKQVDCFTGVETIRDMTPEEIAAIQPAPPPPPEPPEPTKRELRQMLRALKDRNDELNAKIEALA